MFSAASGTDTQPFSGNTDNGAFCTTSAKEVAVVDACCGVGGDYDDCLPNAGDPQDVPYWKTLKDTDRGCAWVAKKPNERCEEMGVFFGTSFKENSYSDRPLDHYGKDWLKENQPQYSASEACPVSCLGKCLDDPSWEYKPEGKDKQKCSDVAVKPEKRCEREGLDGRLAFEACPKACRKHGASCGASTPRPTPRPTYKECSSSRPSGCVDDEDWYDDYSEEITCAAIAGGKLEYDKAEYCNPANFRYKDGCSIHAHEACKKTCGTCGQNCYDKVWRASKGGWYCHDVAEDPEKWCNGKTGFLEIAGERVRTDARDGCPYSCGTCDDANSDTARPSPQPTKKPTIGAAGFEPDNKELKEAIKAWVEDPKKAEGVYGDISEWKTHKVTSLFELFSGADWGGMKKFNEDISGWDVSNVEDFNHALAELPSFNQPVGKWDVSSAKKLDYVFVGSSKFNQPLNSWDTRNVKDMRFIFWEAKAFDQPLDKWDTSNVVDMYNMFGDTSFNQDISGWKTSKVKDMGSMFGNNKVFNQDISGWDVRKVTSMRRMLNGAKAFNQDLSTWSIDSLEDMQQILSGAKKFDQDLGWCIDDISGHSWAFQGTKCEKDDWQDPGYGCGCDECKDPGVKMELDALADRAAEEASDGAGKIALGAGLAAAGLMVAIVAMSFKKKTRAAAADDTQPLLGRAATTYSAVP